MGARETQIIKLLMQGYDNAEIARQLKIARRTVKAHLERLFRRFRITGGISESNGDSGCNRYQQTKIMNALFQQHERRVIQLVAKGLRTVRSRRQSESKNIM
jgi:predicted ArsR family transcriptional regulator